MSWSAHVARQVGFRSDHGVDVREGVTPSGHYGYGWIERRNDGTCIGRSVEWVDDRQTWVLWTKTDGVATSRDVDWPPPGAGGRAGVVRERAGGGDL